MVQPLCVDGRLGNHKGWPYQQSTVGASLVDALIVRNLRDMEFSSLQYFGPLVRPEFKTIESLEVPLPSRGSGIFFGHRAALKDL